MYSYSYVALWRNRFSRELVSVQRRCEREELRRQGSAKDPGIRNPKNHWLDLVHRLVLTCIFMNHSDPPWHENPELLQTLAGWLLLAHAPLLHCYLFSRPAVGCSGHPFFSKWTKSLKFAVLVSFKRVVFLEAAFKRFWNFYKRTHLHWSNKYRKQLFSSNQN